MRPISLFALLLLSAPAVAIDCSKAVTTPDVNACAAVEQKKVEAKLNAVYQRVLRSLEQPNTETENFSEMKRTLVEAQRAWVKFREADCNAIYMRNASGTIRTVMHIGCMQSHAEQRIKELEAYEKQ